LLNTPRKNQFKPTGISPFGSTTTS